jgi:kynurenine formamidase
VHHTQSSPKISAKGFHKVSRRSENVMYPSSNWLEMSEHTGTHVDALSHMSASQIGQTIETMPLTLFIGSGVCLDVSHRSLSEAFPYFGLA